MKHISVYRMPTLFGKRELPAATRSIFVKVFEGQSQDKSATLLSHCLLCRGLRRQTAGIYENDVD